MTIYSDNGVSRILFEFIVSLSVVFKGVFKGGVQGVQPPPPPPKFSDFYLKSEGKEAEKMKETGVGCKLLIYFLGLRYFQGEVEKFSGGGLRNFRGGGGENFSGGEGG